MELLCYVLAILVFYRLSQVVGLVNVSHCLGDNHCDVKYFLSQQRFFLRIIIFVIKDILCHLCK